MAPADSSDEEGSDGPSNSKSGSGKGVIVLDQEDSRIPCEEEVLEYAEYLGIDVETEQDLMWIAREGVIAPVPDPWKACTENGDDVFYFNFETGDSTWDHPSDEHYKELLQEKRKEKAPARRGDEDKHGGAGPAVASLKPDVKTAEACATVPVSADESFSASGSLSTSDSRDTGPAKVSDGGPLKGGVPSKEKAPMNLHETSPGKGLAGVGLAGASLEVPALIPKRAAVPEKEPTAASRNSEGSLEEIEEEEGLDGSVSRSGTRGSSKDGASKGSHSREGREGRADPEPSRSHASDASELSEDFMNDLGSPNSSLVPGAQARARSNSVGGDTMELSLSASALADPAGLPQAGGVAGAEAALASLARSLGALRNIREGQQKYLELLLHGTAEKGVSTISGQSP